MNLYSTTIVIGEIKGASFTFLMHLFNCSTFQHFVHSLLFFNKKLNSKIYKVFGEWVFKTALITLLTFCHHDTKMTPNNTWQQQYLAIARLQTICPKMEVTVELKVSQK